MKLMKGSTLLVIAFVLLYNQLQAQTAIHASFPLLEEPHIDERDVLWEKRIWREIDIKQRMNHHFSSVVKPLISILFDEAIKGSISVYSPIDDAFSIQLSPEEVLCMKSKKEKTIVIDPITFEENLVEYQNDFNPEDIVRYRIKEVWYFDSKYSRMNVRILGIAPIARKYDDSGKLIAEVPLFWVYYPESRDILNNYKTINSNNEANSLTWEEVFKIRYFDSYIVKENNIYDRRIKDYKEGIDIYYESEALKNTMFNYEQDLWIEK